MGTVGMGSRAAAPPASCLDGPGLPAKEPVVWPPASGPHRSPILGIVDWRQAASRRRAGTTRGRNQGRL
jgi:hypothetical protein